jgi:hypothetical protein
MAAGPSHDDKRDASAPVIANPVVGALAKKRGAGGGFLSEWHWAMLGKMGHRLGRPKRSSG